MEGPAATRADAFTALLMAAFFFSFAAFGILRPEKLRNAMDNFADSSKRGSWHPYRMPLPVLRITVGTVGIFLAVLFVYIAYVGLTR